MNALKYLVFLLFLLSCEKEKPDTFRVLGSLRDINTQAPIPGVKMTAYSAGGSLTDLWNGTIYVEVRGSEKTDQNGYFDFEFVKSPGTKVFLGCAEIPSDYSTTANLNGTAINLYLDLDDYYANPWPAAIGDGVYYNVALRLK